MQKGVLRPISRVLRSQVDVDGPGWCRCEVCTDGKDTDLVGCQTGESTVNPTRPRYLLWQMQVVKPATVWLIGDATNEVVGGC